jgi:predicted ATPase/DNA-binding SARP family transcriptional activator
VVEVELLGSPAVRDGAQRRSAAGRQRALLAALTLRARSTVSADRLIDIVWADGSLPADPSNALQQRISELRKLLDPSGRGDVLVPERGGYRLQIDDEQIDARRFERLAAQGRQQLQAGDARGAEQALTRAVGLWRGPALDGVAHEEWAIGDAQRLDELRLSVLEDRIDAMLALGGGHRGTVAELRELVVTHPLRERLRGQLMLALYRTGQQAEALAVYEEARAHLAEELGVDPSPPLQELFGRILTQDTTLDGTTRPATAGNLPAPRSSIIGREEALAEVLHLLDESRLVTLTGPGGAGKTTLAIEAARHRMPTDGSWLVALAPLTTSDAIVPAIAEALDVPARSGFDGGGLDRHTIARTLHGRHLLVVLDNCEHLLEPVGSLVDGLLDAVPGLRILTTSREPLRVPGETLWSVPSLGLPAEEDRTPVAVSAAPSIQLLVERTRAHSPQFHLTEETAPVAARVVRHLDGIPLAIELAAARLRSLSLDELIDGLEDRFRLLDRGHRGTPPRQRSLRGALDWSWDLLDQDLRRGWAAMSAPARWMERDLAGALLEAAGVAADPLDVIGDLVDRSLLVADTTQPVARYRMLESLRDYGRAQLEQLDLRDAVHARYADAVEAALAACETPASQKDFGVDVDGLAAWLDDARVVLRWAGESDDRTRIQRIAGRLGWVWLLRGLASEGLTWLDRALGPPEAIDPAEADPRALRWASALRVAGAVGADSSRWAALAVAAAETPADRVFAEVTAAVHRTQAGDVESAVAALERAVADAEAIGGWPLGFARLVSAQVARVTGQTERVREHAQAAFELLTQAGVDWARVQVLDPLIDDTELRGDYGRMRELALEGLSASRQQGLPELEARMLTQLAIAEHGLGDSDQARVRLEQAIDRASAVGRTATLGYAHVVAGALDRRHDELHGAAAHLTEALTILTESGMIQGMAWARTELAHTCALAGDHETAQAHAAEALAQAARMGEPHAVAVALEALAAAVASGPADDDAMAVLATAAALRATTGSPTTPPEQRDIDHVTARVRNRLGDARFDAGWPTSLANARNRLDHAVQELVARYGPPTAHQGTK